ncbi:hypothetical protein Moror_6563 [Moniliophthora roreri MCA 2997]|uniref:Secreted protein n=1 Tax=Moniliophthora roreri (strain MCA 2997) TaxID=1381753 RepID=V2XWN2_MONRO|nr:hypothetical protein Moror_6563 [Moniliophthora roreri MCA 2997]
MYCFSFLPASLYLPLLISALGIPLSRNSGCAFICPPEDREANPWDNRTGQVNLKSNFQCFYQTERARYGCRYSSLDGSYKAGPEKGVVCIKAGNDTTPRPFRMLSFSHISLYSGWTTTR